MQKPLIVHIMDADKPNANNRVYPRKELERAILEVNQDSAKQRRVFGQVGMPQRGLELEKLAFITGELQLDENGALTGTVAWLDTPAGKEAKAMYEEADAAGNQPWSFRTAGAGKTRVVNGVTEIYDFKISSINMVLNGA